jgi:hypothetical protein
MKIKEILDKALPITPGDKGCRFKMEAKNKLRGEVQKMIEQYVKEKISSAYLQSNGSR